MKHLMKLIAFAAVLFFLLALAAPSFGQYTPVYSPVRYEKIIVNKVLGVPDDTAHVRLDPVARLKPNLAVKDTLLMLWRVSSQSWLTVGKVTSGGIEILWGNVTGDIQDQTDLIALLNQKEDLISVSTVDKYYAGDKTWRDFATDVFAAGDDRYLMRGDTLPGGGSAFGLTFHNPLYQQGTDVFLDYFKPIYNAAFLQSYPILATTPRHGSYLRFNDTLKLWYPDTTHTGSAGSSGNYILNGDTTVLTDYTRTEGFLQHYGPFVAGHSNSYFTIGTSGSPDEPQVSFTSSSQTIGLFNDSTHMDFGDDGLRWNFGGTANHPKDWRIMRLNTKPADSTVTDVLAMTAEGWVFRTPVSALTPGFYNPYNQSDTLTFSPRVTMGTYQIQFWKDASNSFIIDDGGIWGSHKSGSAESSFQSAPFYTNLRVKYNDGGSPPEAMFEAEASGHGALTYARMLYEKGSAVDAMLEVNEDGVHMIARNGTTIGGIHVTNLGSVRMDRLQTSAAPKDTLLMIDGSTVFAVPASALSGATPTWDAVLAEGGTFSANRTGALGSNTLTLTATGSGNVEFNSSIVQGINTNYGALVITGNNTNGTNPWNDKALIVNGTSHFMGGFYVSPSPTSDWNISIGEGDASFGDTYGSQKRGISIASTGIHFMEVDSDGGDYFFYDMETSAVGETLVVYDTSSDKIGAYNFEFYNARALGVYTPSNNTSAAFQNGSFMADDTYLYFRTSTGTWKRIAWSTDTW